jgi:peroxiredoxin
MSGARQERTARHEGDLGSAGSRLERANDPFALPEGLPVPEDDGAADHLEGMRVPSVPLPSTAGREVNVAEVAADGQVVVYCYPLTGAPGVELPEDWDMIPGARGCTPEACSFRDHHDELEALGAEVFGLSTQTTDYQRDLVGRLHLPFEVLSDSELKFSGELRLPTFEIEESIASQPTTLIKRLTLILRGGVIKKVFYPIFPPNEHADEVVAWLSENTTQPRQRAAGS